LPDWKALPSLGALRAFDATARTGSFAAAARALNVTHAAIAQQVRALETQTGTRLAIRSGRSITLTPAGQALAGAINEGFDRIAEGVETLIAKQTHRGLRVTATPFLVDKVIMLNLAGFWADHPGVEISLHPSRQYVDIIREGFDLAIRAVPGQRDLVWPDLDSSHIARVGMIAIASADLAGKTPHAEDLPWIWHDEMTAKLILMQNAGLDPTRLKRARIGSPNLQLEAVRQGIGVTIFNEQFARPFIEAGEIVEIPLPVKQSADYFAVTPKGPQHPLVAPFVDWLRGLLDSIPASREAASPSGRHSL
jgi:LysR family transcriptional regulator, glycine cleavage system transcriptional activator